MKHCGSGHFSVVTTHLYEQARRIVLDYLNLNNSYIVIFTTPRSAEHLTGQLLPGKLSGGVTARFWSVVGGEGGGRQKERVAQGEAVSCGRRKCTTGFSRLDYLGPAIR